MTENRWLHIGYKLTAKWLQFCTAVLVAVALLVPEVVSANPYIKIWNAFQLRCLDPFERFAPPKIDDLVAIAGRENVFQLQSGAVLVLGLADETGSRSCTVEGVGLIKGYRDWSASVLQNGRYRESDTPGLWMSHEWIEPRIIVEKTPGRIRVVESFLES